MSGGAYEYLYVWAGDLEELIKRRLVLEAMSERLSGLPYAADAALETERLIAMIERCETQVRVRGEALQDVWHAVEWWDSADYSEDQVKEALAKYRGDDQDGADHG